MSIEMTERFVAGDIIGFRKSSVRRLIVRELSEDGYETMSPYRPPLMQTTNCVDVWLEDGWIKVGSIAGLGGGELVSELNRVGWPDHAQSTLKAWRFPRGEEEEMGRLSAETPENFGTRAAAVEDVRPFAYR